MKGEQVCGVRLACIKLSDAHGAFADIATWNTSWCDRVQVGFQLCLVEIVPDRPGPIACRGHVLYRGPVLRRRVAEDATKKKK